MEFQINREYSPLADQPRAIEELSLGLEQGERLQTLLGATGTGKTFTAAGVIERAQRPALVMAHNKTLAAQLVAEFRELFPDNAVEYFVSYYDHYQPEAYVPHQDLFIEKDASVNEEIDRMRHAATSSILSRRDTIVVASVSCIYGIGSPRNYQKHTLQLRCGEEVRGIAHALGEMGYKRNDTVLERGSFSWRGEMLEIWPPGGSSALRVRLWGDEIEEIEIYNPLSGEKISGAEEVSVRPASHWVVDEIEEAAEKIEGELQERLRELRGEGKRSEAERLQRRTEYDLEMLRESGWTSGIENYSAVFDGRSPGEPPSTLLDYFPEDFLLFIDESHQTVPQIRAMYEGDRARKQTLVDHGFRLPSAMDNRPLRWGEFWERVGQTICLSATPGDWEQRESARIAEQIVRPTGILDPVISERPTRGQVDNLLGEIKKRQGKERVLVTTLTKKMAEDMSEYLQKQGVRVRYLHSDVETLERIALIRDLRRGKLDVLVGVNLLREGLDIPEVSLVAIFDADKEGFLRGETSLIQTIGRAARHPEGKVIFYGDRESEAMRRAKKETERRRRLQEKYNKKHGIVPSRIEKAVQGRESRDDTDRKFSPSLLQDLEAEMERAAEELRFEDAAELRDEIRELRGAG